MIIEKENDSAPTTSVQLNPAYDPTSVAAYDELAPVETLTYYLYCPKTFVATHSVQVVTNEEPPLCSTKWEPPLCSDNAQAYFDGFGWVRCPPYKSLTPELLRAALTDVAKRELRDSMAELKASVADEESETYLQQYADAQTYLRTGEASTFLMVLSSARNKDMDDLTRTIVRKADVYHTATAKALALYQNAVDAITNTEPVLTQALLQERRLQRV